MDENNSMPPKKKIGQKEIEESINELVNQFTEDKEEPNIAEREFIPPISRIENFIRKRYEIRIDIVSNVMEVKTKGSSADYEANPKLEAILNLELMRAGFKNTKYFVSTLLSSELPIPYHPIRSYFEKLPIWDGKDRITELAECLKGNENERKLIAKHFMKHLVRCVASAFVKGFFNKHCFVIIGVGQSMGKTTFIRNLVPDILKQYSVESILNWKDKDASISLGSNWIINLDELANLNKDESNSLKAILSQNHIKLRRPYEKVETEIPRLANFFGSTNDLQFLTDLTGNVRWICFRIYQIDWETSNQIDRDQMWAQAYHLFLNEFEFQLSKDELKENDQRNEHFMLSSPEKEAIQRYLEPGMKDIQVPELGGLPQFKTASELMRLINGKIGSTFRSDSKFGKALQACGFIKVSERMKHRNTPIWGYWYFEHETSLEV